MGINNHHSMIYFMRANQHPSKHTPIIGDTNSMNKRYETKRLILRTLDETEGHYSQAYYLANRTFLAPFEPERDDSFYELSHHVRMTVLEQTEMDQLRLLRLWIFLKDGFIKRPIGNLAFTNIVRGVFLSCFLGYKLDHHYINQGYMTEALTKAIDVMFSDYGLHRIEANIMPKNKASLALTEKLGFYKEGLAKKYLRIGGTWEDHVHMVKRNEALE